jgi:outer membrane protein, heavy metal efflux system
MRSRLRIYLAIAAGVVATAPLLGQQTEPAAAPPAVALAGNQERPAISFASYLDQALRTNLELAAQRASLDITKASITTARVRPDWSVDFGTPTVDLSNQGNPTNFSTGLGTTIELGGKRGARVKAASADFETSSSDYQDAVRQFRASAAGSFIDALGARDILDAKNRSLSQLDRIVTVNQERNRVGDIGEIELAQSRVERDQFKAEVVSAQAEVYSADIALAQLLGDPQKVFPLLPIPTGTLEIPVRDFRLDALISTALSTRSDILARQRAVKAAELRQELAHVNLIPDLSVSASYSHTATGTGGFVQPADNTLGAGLSVNLPFSRWKNQGEVEAARAARTQAEIQLRAAQLRAEVEIRDAHSKYLAAVQRLQLYRGGLLKDAERVLDARLYAYQRGGATLLELIDAQRTDTDVHLAYSQALADHARALVNLEQAANFWDITF